MPTTTEAKAAPVQQYDSAFAPAPPSDTSWPLSPAFFEQFINTGTVITFTALVPLEKLVNDDIDGLNKYVQEAFDSHPNVELSNTEFRVIPNNTDSQDGWDDRFQGDVALQVTGTLSAE